MLVRFESEPAELAPERIPSPLNPGRPHALAARAAEETQRYIAAQVDGRVHDFQGPLGGKMFGVLVVRDREGRLGYLRGFGGMLGKRWLCEGFVPPLFDGDEYERIWGPGGDEIAALDRALSDAEHRAAEAPSKQGAQRVRELKEARSQRSRELHVQLQELYRIQNARGERRGLRELFAPRVPPGGAGDCAGPKLVGHAHALGLRPLVLAEFWWGRAPPAGGRQHGMFYPACRGRCSVILPFMLEGLPREPDPDIGLRGFGPEQPQVIYEDADILVVDKPSGMLSVPGRGPRRLDSVEHRLQQRAGHSEAEQPWPRLVHRLDLATSGLLIAAKHKPAYVGLQRQFSARALDKRYVALLSGQVAGEGGEIDLPLIKDFDDRPRQIVDPRRGKPARTRWELLERGPEHTRVALYPKTGRTHQLRLHAAHPRGLGAPIVGDMLYGFGEGEALRLMLHAQGLCFRHPVTDATLELSSPCPF